MAGWGEIGQVQVKHRTTTTTTPTAAIQTPNVTINVKKVGRGKIEPMKLNATKVSQSRKKMNWSSLSSLSFVSNIQDSFTNMAAMSTKYSTMVAELAPWLRITLAFCSHYDFCHRCCNTREIDGFYFWLLCVVLVCYARKCDQKRI